MSTPTQNLNRAAEDLLDIKQAIINQGVEIPSGTQTSEYKDKIAQISQSEYTATLNPRLEIETDTMTGKETLYAGDLKVDGELKLEIPQGVTDIGENVFNSTCYHLTSLIIPDSVINIGNAAFTGCHALTTLTIPDSVTSIGETAFADCYALTSLTIPNSITSIGDSAFRAMGTHVDTSQPIRINLTAFDSSSIPTISGNAFENHRTIDFKFVFKDQETLNAFASATNWAKYADDFIVAE